MVEKILLNFIAIFKKKLDLACVFFIVSTNGLTVTSKHVFIIKNPIFQQWAFFANIASFSFHLRVPSGFQDTLGHLKRFQFLEG